MAAGDEVDALRRALAGLGVAAGEVLADHPGRRRVVRAGDVAEPARRRFHDRCRATLDELVAGTWPAWPHL